MAGIFDGVVIFATDVNGAGSGSATFTITITSGVTISGMATLPETAPGAVVSATYTAAGGQTPYTWSSANLPGGLAVNSTTGALTGTPTLPGNFSFSINVVDANKTSATPFAVTRCNLLQIAARLTNCRNLSQTVAKRRGTVRH